MVTDRHRRSIRLHGFDYASPGAYFVTICTHDRADVLGEIVDRAMVCNDAGRIVVNAWNALPAHYANVALDTFVVMPNHVHGIIVLTHQDRPAPTRHGLPEIVRAFKTFSARGINDLRGTAGAPVWQRNYHERVIRDGDELNRIRQYIAENPARWKDDAENQPGPGPTGRT